MPGKDPKFHQEEAFRLDATGMHGVEAEAHYLKALELASESLLNWRRYIVFLANRARHLEAEENWRTAIRILPRNDQLYLELHIPYCAMLLRHAEADRSQEVLSDIPEEFQRSNKDIHGMRNLIMAYKAAIAESEVFPLSVHFDDWNSGPHLTNKEGVARWLAGKITWTTDKVVNVLLGEPPFFPARRGWLSGIERNYFDRCCVGEKAPAPVESDSDRFEARFIEIVYRAEKEDPEVYFHPKEYFDDKLPDPELDEYRYTRHWGA